MGFKVTKPVFQVSNKVMLKPACSATGTAKKIKIVLVVSSDMILSNEQITKAPSRLCGSAGWSVPLLFTNPRIQVFSCQGPYDIR